MAVNSPLPVAAELKPVAGIEIGYAQAGIKKPGRKDVLVMRLSETATVAGVFTKNRFCAAPVQLSKAHLAKVSAAGPAIRALVVNTGNANAGTGEEGLARARQTCAALADLQRGAPAGRAPVGQPWRRRPGNRAWSPCSA